MRGLCPAPTCPAPATATPTSGRRASLAKIQPSSLWVQLLWGSQGLNLPSLTWGLSQVTSLPRKLLCANTSPSAVAVRNPLCCTDLPSLVPSLSPVYWGPLVFRGLLEWASQTRTWWLCSTSIRKCLKQRSTPSAAGGTSVVGDFLAH